MVYLFQKGSSRTTVPRRIHVRRRINKLPRSYLHLPIKFACVSGGVEKQEIRFIVERMYKISLWCWYSKQIIASRYRISIVIRIWLIFTNLFATKSTQEKCFEIVTVFLRTICLRLTRTCLLVIAPCTECRETFWSECSVRKRRKKNDNDRKRNLEFRDWH